MKMKKSEESSKVQLKKHQIKESKVFEEKKTNISRRKYELETKKTKDVEVPNNT